jgi:hypothetical protein
MNTHRAFGVLFLSALGLFALQGCSSSSEDDAQSADELSGGNCVPGGYYCGGDKVVGDSNSIYQCESGNKGKLLERCAAGCKVNSGTDDACKPLTNHCVNNGHYCGGDKLDGHPDSLYQCWNDDPSDASYAMFEFRCANGCQVNSGRDDSCKPITTAVVNGRYCGGDKVDGDPNVLYVYKGDGKADQVSYCDHGCQVNSGRDDSCRTSGDPDETVYGMQVEGYSDI